MLAILEVQWVDLSREFRVIPGSEKSKVMSITKIIYKRRLILLVFSVLCCVSCVICYVFCTTCCAVSEVVCGEL